MHLKQNLILKIYFDMKRSEITINVLDIIGVSTAVSSNEGDKLFQVINNYLGKEEHVILDFNGLTLIISAFLNASVGQLYGTYSSEFIKEHLTVIGLSNDDLHLLKKVNDRAKEYFSQKEDFNNTIKDSL